MPVMYLSKHNEGLFLNLCEFVYTPGAIEALLLCGHEEEISERVDEEVEISNDPSIIVKSRRAYFGQPALISKFPDIINTAADFVKQQWVFCTVS